MMHPPTVASYTLTPITQDIYIRPHQHHHHLTAAAAAAPAQPQPAALPVVPMPMMMIPVNHMMIAPPQPATTAGTGVMHPTAGAGGQGPIVKMTASVPPVVGSNGGGVVPPTPASTSTSVHRTATGPMSQMNCAWSTLEDCPYERFPPGDLIKVMWPVQPSGGRGWDLDGIPTVVEEEEGGGNNTKQQKQSGGQSKHRHQGTIKLVPSQAIIKTRLFHNLRRDSKHLDMQRPTCKACAHFLYKGECNRGADCQFVHPVHLASPAATPQQLSTNNNPIEEKTHTVDQPQQQQQKYLQLLSETETDTSYGSYSISAPLTPQATLAFL